MVKTPCLVAFLIRQQLCFSGISPVYCDATPRASVFTGSCGEIRCHFDKEKEMCDSVNIKRAADLG